MITSQPLPPYPLGEGAAVFCSSSSTSVAAALARREAAEVSTKKRLRGSQVGLHEVAHFLFLSLHWQDNTWLRPLYGVHRCGGDAASARWWLQRQWRSGWWESWAPGDQVPIERHVKWHLFHLGCVLNYLWVFCFLLEILFHMSSEQF